MILKAGTYRFNDVITPMLTLSAEEIGDLTDECLLPLNFTDYRGNSFIGISCVLLDGEYSDELVSNIKYENYCVLHFDKDANGNGESYYGTGKAIVGEIEINGAGWNDDYYPDCKTITVLKDAEADATKGAWFIDNTNYNEVNGSVTPPLAEITYNGETIAQLNAGETAILSCEGMKMASDVVVKIGKLTNGATAYTVSSVDELPSDAVDGSMAIVPSDSITGKWIWKDGQGQLDLSMLNLSSLGDNYEVTVLIDGYDEISSQYFNTINFIFDGVFKIKLIGYSCGETLLYIDDSFDDYYQNFYIYQDVSSIVATINGGVGTEPPFTAREFNTFIETNCNRLSGGYSLYTRENGEWVVYKCEVV